jgi:4-hydroxy-3-methylbut-2-enyl diphosphate reductase
VTQGDVGAALVVAAPLRVEALALRRGDASLRVVRTGYGPARARAAAALLRRDPARAVAIAGVCGALDPSLVPGTVLVADALLAPDGTVKRRLDGEPLRVALAARGIPAQRVVLAGVEQLMLRRGAHDALVAAGARAVDMESAWLAEGAGDRPLAVLRVVSDGPGHELWRPSIVVHGLAALRRLAAAAPALARWAAGRAGDAARSPAGHSDPPQRAGATAAHHSET